MKLNVSPPKSDIQKLSCFKKHIKTSPFENLKQSGTDTLRMSLGLHYLFVPTMVDITFTLLFGAVKI